MMSGHPDENGLAVPEDRTLAALSAALDALGERDRRSAPAGLAARIADATAADLRAGASGSDVGGLRIDAASTAARRSFGPTSLRLAAAIALVGAVGAAWLAQRAPTGVQSGAIAAAVGEDEGWSVFASVLDGAAHEEIGAIRSDAASLDEGLLNLGSSTDGLEETL